MYDHVTYAIGELVGWAVVTLVLALVLGGLGALVVVLVQRGRRPRFEVRTDLISAYFSPAPSDPAPPLQGFRTPPRWFRLDPEDQKLTIPMLHWDERRGQWI